MFKEVIQLSDMKNNAINMEKDFKRHLTKVDMNGQYVHA